MVGNQAGTSQRPPVLSGELTQLHRKAIQRLLDSLNLETSVPEDLQTSEKQLRLLDELATQRLLDAGGQGVNVRRKVLYEEALTR